MKYQKAEIYTDGAAKSNPVGPGGYAAIVKLYNDDDSIQSVEEFAGGHPKTSNNRMELMGVIVGLEALEHPSEVSVVSDSSYVVNAFCKKWVDKWLSNGWKTAGGHDVKNQDLWERLLEAKSHHKVTFRWVKGHAVQAENERCDFLASTMCDPFNRLVKVGKLYVEKTEKE